MGHEGVKTKGRGLCQVHSRGARRGWAGAGHLGSWGLSCGFPMWVGRVIQSERVSGNLPVEKRRRSKVGAERKSLS